MDVIPTVHSLLERRSRRRRRTITPLPRGSSSSSHVATSSPSPINPFSDIRILQRPPHTPPRLHLQILDLPIRLIEISLQHLLQHGRAHRFGEVIVHPGLETFLPIAADGARRHGYDQHAPHILVLVAADQAGSVVAVQDGHLAVHQHQVEGVVLRGSMAQGFDGLEAVGVGGGVEAEFGDEGDGDLLVDRVVLGDADAEFGAGDEGEVDVARGGFLGFGGAVRGPGGCGVLLSICVWGVVCDGSGFGSFRESDSEGDGGAFAKLRFERYFPIQDVNQGFTDGKAETTAAIGALRAAVGLRKGLEESAELLLGDANTGVGHSAGNLYTLLVLQNGTRTYGDGTFRGEFVAVAQKVHEDLVQSHRITHDQQLIVELEVFDRLESFFQVGE